MCAAKKIELEEDPAICPVCNIELDIIELERYRFYFCSECRGMFIPPFEYKGVFELPPETLKILFSSTKGENKTIFSENVSKEEGERLCPVCREKMELKNFKGVWLNICKRDGIWFDPSELETVYKIVTGKLEEEKKEDEQNQEQSEQEEKQEQEEQLQIHEDTSFLTKLRKVFKWI